MPRLRFRLESVLRYRQQIVEQRQQELMALEQAARACELELRETEAAIAGLCRKMAANLQPGNLDCALALQGFQHWEALRGLAARQVAAIAQARAAAEDKRAELRAALQAKQALDKLKERQQALQRQEEAYREARTLDELAVIHYHQRAQGVGETEETV